MRLAAAACLLSLLAAGCSAADPSPAPEELRVAVRQVPSLDPLAASERTGAEALVIRQVFEGLTGYDSRTLAVRPALAGSWSVSPDARTYRFLLRPGVRFHSGRDLTSADVVYSLNRLAKAACAEATSPVAGAPSTLLSAIAGYQEASRDCTAPTLAGLTAPDASTVQIVLAEPWADFPAVLGHPATSIIPAGAGDDPAFGRSPDGTGVYRVAEAWDGTSLRLAASDRSWGPKPKIRSVRLVGHTDDSLGYLDLLQGKVHVAAAPPDRARQARRRFGTDGFRRGVGMYLFGFNLVSRRMAPHPFREGLSRAIDRASLATAVFEGTREPARGIVSPAIPGATEDTCGEPCTFDVGAARAKIAEAYPDGPPEIVIGIPTGGSNPAVGTALVRMFAAAGVTARVLERPFAEHFHGINTGDVDIFQLGWVPPYPAIDGVLWPLYRSGSPDNYMRYHNPDVDRMLDEARRTLDDAARRDIALRAARQIEVDRPVLPLLWHRSSLAFDSRLTATDGVLVDGLGLIDFATLAFEPDA